jgi:hypothetical protein
LTPFMTAVLGENFDISKKTVEMANPNIYSNDDDLEEASVAVAAKKSIKKVSNMFAKAATITRLSTGNTELEETKEDPEINVIREYVTELEGHLKLLVTSSQALVKSTLEKSKAIHDFGVPVGGWKSTHRNNIAKEESDNMLEMMSAVVVFSDDFSSLLEKQREQEQSKLEQGMQQLSLEVKAFQRALKTRRELQVTFTTRIKQINGKLAAIDKQGKNNKAPEVIEKLQVEKKDLEKDSFVIKKKLEECSLRVIREASRVQPQLEKAFTTCFRDYAEIQIEHSNKARDAWTALLPRLQDGTKSALEQSAPTEESSLTSMLDASTLDDTTVPLESPPDDEEGDFDRFEGDSGLN